MNWQQSIDEESSVAKDRIRLVKTMNQYDSSLYIQRFIVVINDKYKDANDE